MGGQRLTPARRWGTVILPENSAESLWQVTAPHFCAGVIVGEDGIIKRAAPILRYVEGKRLQWLKTYCQHKRWEINSVCTYVIDC